MNKKNIFHWEIELLAWNGTRRNSRPNEMGQFVSRERGARALEVDTHLIPGKFLDGTQGRIRELHIDKLFVVVEWVLSGQVVEWVGREAGSHLIITLCPAILLPDCCCSCCSCFLALFHFISCDFFNITFLLCLPPCHTRSPSCCSLRQTLLMLILNKIIISILINFFFLFFCNFNMSPTQRSTFIHTGSFFPFVYDFFSDISPSLFPPICLYK